MRACIHSLIILLIITRASGKRGLLKRCFRNNFMSTGIYSALLLSVVAESLGVGPGR